MERLDRLREALDQVLGEVPEVAAAYVFGSQIQGRALPMSDLDLAFVLRDRPRPKDPLFTRRLYFDFLPLLERDAKERFSEEIGP